jgi:subtilisin family serine protease
VWIVPISIMILGMVLGPVLFLDTAFAEEGFPEKFAPDRLLIKFKKDTSDSDKEKILKENTASVLSEIKPLDIKILKVPEHALEKVQAAFAKHNAVQYVEKDYIFELAVLPNDQYYSNQWHLPAINAPSAWDISQGSSIPIAILDTGVDPNHSDLKNKLVLGYNFYNNNNDWSDVCGHGTAVAGSASAITNNGIGVAGVAWNNPIIPIKITDANCYGYYSSMINGIVYAADKGARVANISFQIFNGAALSDAARYMNDRGGWVVAAAGNTGKLEDYADNPYIISVGATSSSGTITSFSSYGPYVDFAAPGSSIYTTRVGSTYGYASGTSFASPIVSGVVALVVSNNPSMNSQQIYDALKNSAVDKGTTGRDNYYGWGVVDAYGALLQNSPPPPPIDTTPPTVTITNPQNGADVTGSFTVTVDSSDDVAVSQVDLYLDGIFYSQKTSMPYSFTLDANTMSEGSHQIKAVSIDTSSNSNSDTITVNVVKITPDDTPPDVSITSPLDGATINGITTVKVDATDNVSVSLVELYVNGNLYDTKTSVPYDFVLDSKNLPTGTNILKSKAYDSNNNYNEDSISVVVESLPSSISITNPTNGATVNGRVKISAVPANFATTPSVKFFIDGVLKSTDSTSPYEYQWNTKSYSSGTHTITAQGFDSKGNTASASISVSIPEKSTAKKNSEPPGKGKNSQEVDFSAFVSEAALEIIEVSMVESEEDEILFAEAPVFEPVEPQTVTEGDSISINIVASDPEGDSLSFPLDDQILPPFATLTDNDDGTATLDINPGLGDAGEYTLIVLAIDDAEEPTSNTISISLTVLAVNTAPELSFEGDTSVTEGLTSLITIIATDGNGDELELSVAAPSFVTLVENEEGSFLEFSPGFEDAGEYTVTVRATEIKEDPLFAEESFILTVLESSPESVIIHLKNLKDNLDTEEIKNLGERVSYAAQLHKLLAGATKEERMAFQAAFHEYRDEAKRILGIGQGNDQKTLQEIRKAELRLDVSLAEMDKEDKAKQMVISAIEYRGKQKELIDLRNHIGALEYLLNESQEKHKILNELREKKNELAKSFLILDAKQNGKELSAQDIADIEEKVANENSPKSGNTKSSDNGSKSESKASGASSSGDKGKSAKSDNGSSAKSNNGKSSNAGGNGKAKNSK